MSKRRIVDTRFWSDNFVSELNPLDRYLFLYFLTNEHTNICGIYEVPLKRIADETGIDKEMVAKMLKRLRGRIEYIDGWVAIKNFAKYQSDNESVRIGAEKARKLVPQHILQRVDTLLQAGTTVGTASDISEPEPELESEPKSSSAARRQFNPLGADILKAFEAVDPKNKTYYRNKTQRAACDFLIEEYGVEKTIAAIKILPTINAQKLYIRQITTPYELKDNWVKIGNAIRQKSTARRGIINAADFHENNASI